MPLSDNRHHYDTLLAVRLSVAAADAAKDRFSSFIPPYDLRFTFQALTFISQERLFDYLSL